MKMIISTTTFLLLLNFFAVADEYRDVISSTPGLVAHWSFEEQPDPRLGADIDSKSDDTALTVQSGAFYPGGGTLRTVIRLNDNSGKFSGRTEEVKTGENGISGRAFRFNGKDSVVYIFRHPAFESGVDDFSMDLWINPENFEKRYSVAVRLSPFGKGWGGWYLTGGTKGELTFTVRLRENEHISVTTPPGTLRTGLWQHLAAVRKGGSIYVYLNGEQVATAAGKQELRIPDFGDITLGSDQFGVNHAGLMDEFAYYRQALSQEEIRKHFRTGLSQLQK